MWACGGLLACTPHCCSACCRMMLYVSTLRQSLTCCLTPTWSFRGDLIIPRVHLSKYGQRSFAYVAQHIWNSLPQQLKDSSLSLNVFKRKLKTHFLSMSSLDCNCTRWACMHWQRGHNIIINIMCNFDIVFSCAVLWSRSLLLLCSGKYLNTVRHYLNTTGSV